MSNEHLGFAAFRLDLAAKRDSFDVRVDPEVFDLLGRVITTTATETR